MSEREIQDRLYGGYLGTRRRAYGGGPTAGHPAEQGVPIRAASEPWTGSGILTGELDRLRSELIALREQKDQLATALQQLSRSSGPGSAPEARAASRWVGRLAAIAVLVGAGAYLVGGRLLQASPATGDPTPFTVQVAVYDTRVPAQLAVQFLEGMSYGAFLVEVPRKDGKVRYRICTGRYVTKDEAEMERLRLVGDPRFSYFKDAFVRLR